MSNQREGEDVEHLDGLECGAGCTEIWEHLSEHRRDEQRRDEQADDD